jgi:hypothetical protein
MLSDVQLRQAVQLALAVGWTSAAAGVLRMWADLGFPDGHLTPLDRAHQWAYPVAVGLCVLGAVVTVFLPHRHLRRAVGVFVVTQALLWAAEAAMRATYDHGGGG